MTRHRFLSLVVLACATAISAPCADWIPIDPAQLAMKTPLVDKDADAEALFWHARVEWDDSARNNVKTVIYHYVRIKIFTERGKESQSNVQIRVGSNSDVSDIAARTIKPDGGILELKKDAVFDGKMRVGGQTEARAKSFSLAGVEPGSIIEYRYREVLHERLFSYVPLLFQRDIPVQLVKYSIKPQTHARTTLAMRSRSFQCANTPLEYRDGVYVTTLTNVPAFHAEPHMPPEATIRPWALVYYSDDRQPPPDKFWHELSRGIYEKFREIAKVNDNVRQAAEQAVGDASQPEEKLRRLFAYCRSSIKNVKNRDAESDDNRTDFKRNGFPADTLKQKAGTGADINTLFAAMAIAAGFDARPTSICDRSRFFFDPTFFDGYFLNGYNIAIRIGDEWRFFDPAGGHIPFGMLHWSEEGTAALISGPKGATQLNTPLSPPQRSLRKRTTNLTLRADGSIEGDVRIEYHGHFADEGKAAVAEESPTRREEKLVESVHERLANAEVTDVHVENVADPDKPLVETYHVRMPGYAQITGKRLLLQPAFFQRGVAAVFSTSLRKYPIYFHYPWLEEDTVTIQPPTGFVLESTSTPAPLAGKLGKYEVKIDEDNGKLVYTRRFRFGDNSSILFPTGDYPQLKKIFDWIFKSDGYTISLRQTGTV